MQIELKYLHRKLGVTTVYVTHDQREALTMSDRIAVINHGRLAQVDTPEAIYNKPANAFVADFIGESTMLPLVRGESGQLFYKDLQITSDAVAEASEGWSLVVRPERLYVLNGDDHDPGKTIVFRTRVIESVFQGESAFALLALDDGTELSVRFGTGSEDRSGLLKEGDEISIALNREDVIVIPGDGQA
jgi:putative spermidine/putrescine transport system ATP-binding protein